MALDDREFDVVLFDLDDTLYDAPEIGTSVRNNIIAYLRDVLGVDAADVEATTVRLYGEHGTTIAGMVAEGARVDFDHFHDQVHATLDYERILKPNGVREMLAGLTAQKHIFTNADANHAAACLKQLDLEGCFEVRGGSVGLLGAMFHQRAQDETTPFSHTHTQPPLSTPPTTTPPPNTEHLLL
jgi:FMN phosphatase YigB (HAD superfamily)